MLERDLILVHRALFAAWIDDFVKLHHAIMRQSRRSVAKPSVHDRRGCISEETGRRECMRGRDLIPGHAIEIGGIEGQFNGFHQGKMRQSRSSGA
jgi:hypothetical protein